MSKFWSNEGPSAAMRVLPLATWRRHRACQKRTLGMPGFTGEIQEYLLVFWQEE
jgi:hypothetical protein